MGRLTKEAGKRFEKIVRDSIVSRYGKGPASAWAHMSEEQRRDALLAQGALLVLAQAETTAEKLTLADAQEMLRVAIGEG